MYMKRIRIKMAGVEHETTTDNIIGKNGDVTEKGKKKNGFYKGLKKGVMKYISPKKPQKADNQLVGPDHVEPEKEITAEDIKEQIEINQFWNASKHLISLEHEMFSTDEDTLQQDKIEELESLYDQLGNAVFKVIKDSISETQEDRLVQAVQAIVEQEGEDSKYVSDSGSVKGNSLRPKKWKVRWENEIKLSVVERIESLPEVSTNEASSSLSQTFVTVGKTFKKDLIHVVKHLKPCYPEEFDVCNTYAQHYHRFIMSQMDVITEYELGGKDTYFLLCWVQNLYPNIILKDPTIVGHIDESKLKRLLPPHKIRQFEANYFSYEIESVRTYMNKSLDLEVERWKSGNEPEMLGDYYHSELLIDIIQCYNGGIQKAAELQLKLSVLLGQELEEFIKRYKRLFGEYLEKNKTQVFYRAISIANLNCCLHFREFIRHKDSKLEPRAQEDLQTIILELEDLIYDFLFQDLFAELKSQFRKISQGNGLCSHQTMIDIIKITDRHLSPFKTLCLPCYKDMISKIHKHLVKEYLARLLKKKVAHKNAAQLQALAKQINENTKLIDEFFVFHNSEEDWLKPAILKVAEIIRLQDLSAIQLEVATLVEAYPDIRNSQVEAILFMKGNLTKQERKSILKIVDSVERTIADKPRLFELIKNS
ncbi:tumor necrosis factor alpha-induced protein 2 [Mixophyes fleayi]|uniref:tumor necrosis factor alpha-induced protein 2 n=1 Tax=Mixophyes fleayi TaxID=3061075 RepID=UPI003F4DC6D2